MAYLLQDSFGWDVRNWSRALRHWQAGTQLPVAGSIALELGVGSNGGISLWLAAHGASVVCSAFDPTLEAARQVHRRHGVDAVVRYLRASTLDIPVRAGSLDLVVVKSVLGGIGRSGATSRVGRAVEEMHRVLRPGGEVWFAENLSGSAAHRYFRNRSGAGRNGWFYFAVDELAEVFSSFSGLDIADDGLLGAFGRTEPQRRALSYADGALLPLAPRRWRYFGYGVARK